MLIDRECARALKRGRAHDWGDEQPYVGQRVEDMGSAGFARKGQQGTVVRVKSGIIRIRMDDGYETPFGWWLWRFRPIAALNLNEVRTRGGHSVVHVELRGDFIMGVVKVGDTTLALRYHLSGLFMPPHQCPVDLVEA